MECADKAETTRRAEGPGEGGERDVTPPSPIRLGTEAGVGGEFDLPDPQELRKIESDTQSRLKAILEVAGVTGLSQIDAQTFQDPEILRKLTNRFVISGLWAASRDCHVGGSPWRPLCLCPECFPGLFETNACGKQAKSGEKGRFSCLMHNS